MSRICQQVISFYHSVKRLLLLVLLFLCSALSYGQGGTSFYDTGTNGRSWWNTDYNTTEGTEFWVTYLNNYGSQDADKDIKLQLYVTSRSNTEFSVYAYKNGTRTILYENIQIKAGERSDNIDISNEYAYAKDHDSIEYKAIYIESKEPISVFTYSYLSDSQDASCVYPTKTVMRTKSVSVSGTGDNDIRKKDNGYVEYKPSLNDYIIQTYNSDGVATEFAVVATEDLTEIKIELKETSFLNYKASNEEYTGIKVCDTIIDKKLRKGQVYYYRAMAMAKRYNSEYTQTSTSLSGTTICSNKNIVVFQGGQHAAVPTLKNRKNHIYTQALPSNLSGKEYIVTQFENLTRSYILLTSTKEDTKIRIIDKEGNTKESTIVKARETLTYKLSSDYCRIISDKEIICYQYLAEQNIDDALVNLGEVINKDDDYPTAPAMLPIIPLEQRFRSIIYPTFDNTATKHNYVNIIIFKGINKDINMKIRSSNKDKSPKEITIPNANFINISGTSFYYCRYKLDVNYSSHLLYNANHDFIASAYGYGFNENKNRADSYAYAIGSNLLHPAWMLIDGERIDQKSICIDKTIDLEGVVNYDYSSFRWRVLRDAVEVNFPKDMKIDDYQFEEDGRYEIQMIVGRKTPICEYTISDTIKAVINVSKKYEYQPSKSLGTDIVICEDDRSSEVVMGKGIQSYDNPTPYEYRTDTMKPNHTYYFTDLLTTEDMAHCDSLLHIKVFIAPNETKTYNDKICYNHLPYLWKIADGHNDTITNYINASDIGKIKSFPYTYKTRDTVETQYGCKRVVMLNLTIHEVKRDTIDTVICSAQLPYKWKVHNKTIEKTESGMYNDTVSAAEGCDDISTLILTVNDTFEKDTTISMCVGESFYWSERSVRYAVHNTQWRDTVITTSGTYTRRLKTSAGCDDIRTLHITFNPLEQVYDTIRKCQSELPILWPYSDDYIKDTTVIDIQGWTGTTFSSYTPPYEKDFTITTYTDKGCAKTVYRHCVIYPTYRQDTVAEICEGDYVVWEGQKWYGKQVVRSKEEGADYYGSNKYIDDTYTKEHKTKANGCDSVRTLTLKVKQRGYKKIIDSGCEPFTYTFNGKERTYSAGVKGDTVYYDTLRTTRQGCDSIVCLELNVWKTYEINDEPLTINNHTPFDWNNLHYESLTVGEHNFTDNLYTVNYCDSIMHIHVTVLPAYINEESKHICQNEEYQWEGHFNDTVFKNLAPGTYTIRDEHQTTMGQDSSFTLHLYVHPTYNNQPLPMVSLCQGQTHYEWRREDNGQLIRDIQFADDLTYPYSQTYTDTLHTINGCDSIVHLPITIYPTYSTSVYGTICESELPYQWNDNKGKMLQEITLNDVKNADTWHSPEWLYSTTYRHQSQHQCDSLLTLYLTVKPTLRNTVQITLCPEQLPYMYCVENNKSVPKGYKGGTENEKLVSKQYGCDSIVTYNITVREKIERHLYDTICDNEEHYNHPTESAHFFDLSVTGIYRDTLSAVSGCDSINILHLQVNRHSVNDTTIYRCLGEQYIDQDYDTITFTHDSVYTKTLLNAVRCDSIVKVTVLFGDTFRVKERDTILCESDGQYEWITYDTYRPQGYSHLLSWDKLNEQVLDTVLYDTLHTAQPFYCDSITIKRIIVKPTLYTYLSPFICPENLPYKYNDETEEAYTSGEYTFSVPSLQYGCDSVVTIYLTVRDSIVYRDTLTICDNDSVSWQGILYVGDKYEAYRKSYNATLYKEVKTYSAGRYSDEQTYTTVNNCDSTYFLTLFVLPSFYTEQERDACQEEYVEYEAMNNGQGGVVSTMEARDITYQDTITASNGCDSIVRMTYHIHPVYRNTQRIKVCQDTVNTQWEWVDEYGGSHGFYDRSKSGSFIHGDTLKTIHHCDSIFGVELYVSPIYRFDTTLYMCENDTVSWQGVLFVGSQYNQFHRTYDESLFDSVRTNMSAGMYSSEVQRYTVKDSCDSTYLARIIVSRVADTTIYVSVCQNDEYEYTNLHNGKSGLLPTNRVGVYTYQDTITSSLGCDSLITLIFRVDSVYDYRQHFSVCQDMVNKWRWVDDEGHDHGLIDISVAKDTTIEEKYTTIYGCDSIYGLSLHIKPSYHIYDTIHLCQTDRATWQNKTFTGDSALLISDLDSIILSPSVYYDTARYQTSEKCASVLNCEDCDSIYYLTLYVHPIYDTLTITNACRNEGFVWKQQDRFGIYQNTVISAAKVDTTYILPYQAVLPQAAKNDTVIYRDTMLRSWYGCDSLSRLQLTVRPSYFFLSDTTICATDFCYYLGQYFSYQDTTFIEAKVPGKTVNGCDSIYCLRLHIIPIFIAETFDTLCDNQTYYHTSKHGQEIVWKPGDAIVDPAHRWYDMRYRDHHGCDSIYRYHLQIYPTYAFFDTIEVCSNQTFSLHNDSLIALWQYYDITDIPQSPIDTNFSDTLQTVHGCDSIYHLYATLFPAYKHIDYDTICSNDTYTKWRGRNITKSLAGDTICVDSLLTIHGCDSIYELRLHVKQAYDYPLSVQRCIDELPFTDGAIEVVYGQLQKSDPYTWTYSNTYNFLTRDGCDSIIHLSLAVYDTTQTFLYDTICAPAVYYPLLMERDSLLAADDYSVSYTEQGSYVYVTTNKFGCKHTVYTHLVVIPPTNFTLTLPPICADESNFEINYTYEGRPIESYTVIFDDAAQEQGFENIYNQRLSKDELTNLYFTVPIPQGETLPMPGVPYFETWSGQPSYIKTPKKQYPRPDIYRMRVILHNGLCSDEQQTRDTLLNILYPSWIHEQHWNDGIVLFNEIYNGGYEFSRYQWYYNDKPIIGQTREYLYWLDSLNLNFGSEIDGEHCPSEYRVLLTRTDDGHSQFTCPICPIRIDDHIVPKKDYFAVVPTLVVASYPYVWILSSLRGEYYFSDVYGHPLSGRQRFVPDENNYVCQVEVPTVAGFCFITIRTDDGDMRTFKIVIVPAK